MIRSILPPLAASLIFASTAAGAQTFDGPRVELNAGYDRLNTNDRFPDLPGKVDGVRLGGATGYDVAVGPRLVLGVEAGAGWIISSKTTTTIANDRVSEKLSRDLELSIRAGLIVAQKTLLFAKAGYANSRFEVIYDEAVGGGSQRTRYDITRGGLRLGAGVEQSLGGNSFVKAEYRWTHYSDSEGYVRTPVRHQLLLGVGVRF